MTKQQLLKKSGSKSSAINICNDMIQCLQKRLSILKTAYHKIEQYQNELEMWTKLKAELS